MIGGMNCNDTGKIELNGWFLQRWTVYVINVETGKSGITANAVFKMRKVNKF